MRNIILILSLVFCLGFMDRAFYIWQQARLLQHKNFMTQKEIGKFQIDFKRLEALPGEQLDLIEDNYRYLDEQTYLFSRYHDLKTSLEIDKLGKEGLILSTVSPSSWPGIGQMSLHIHFYELKGMDQYMAVLQFLRIMETADPVRVLSIVQKGNHLQARLQLYGREI